MYKSLRPEDNAVNYVRKKRVFVPGTKPPKIVDLQISTDPFLNPDYRDYHVSPYNLKYVFGKNDFAERTPPSDFLIQEEDLNTGFVKKYLQRADQTPYKLWQKWELAFKINELQNTLEYIDLQKEIPYSIINSRIHITPLNEHGAGPTSTFILPLKDITAFHKMDQNVYPFTFLLQRYWDIINPVSKFIFIYLDVPHEIIEKDHIGFQDKKWRFTSPKNNWLSINQNVYRWLYDDNSRYLRYNTDDGWVTLNDKEKEFLQNTIDIIAKILPHELTKRNIDFGDNYILKFLIENPFNRFDSFFLYFMKGCSWQI